MSLTPLDVVAEGLERVEARLAAELAAADRGVAELVTDLTMNGGKRLRPALVLLWEGRTPPSDAAIAVAAGAELIHAATLIHDDVIDDSPQRRGIDAVHVVAGPGAAIIAGDHQLTHGLQLTAEGGIATLGLFAGAVREICAGEIRQMSSSRDLGRDHPAYLTAITGKTAVLLRACCEAGAHTGGAGGAARSAAATYGMELGRAFQMADDALDYAGSSADLGKPVGADLRQGIVTLPLMLALNDPHAGERLRTLLDPWPGDEASLAAVIEFVNASGATAAALRMAAGHVARAVAVLDAAPAAARRPLADLAEFVISRSV